MISTSRMQHMSWHLSKDADLNRYQCSQCDFGRYSGEKVRRHCKTYHKRTVKMLDKTVEYRDEMAAKMDECFGVPSSPTNSNELNEPQRVLRRSSYPPQVTCGVCAKSMSSKVRVQHVLLHLSRDKGINRYQCSKCDMGSDRRSFFKQHMKKEHAGASTIIDNIIKHQEVYAALHEDCFGERKSLVVPNSKVMTQKRLTVQFKRETRSSLRLSRSLDQELSQSPDSVGGEEEIQVASSKQT
uniref:C2H2-type domain-containing protein n=1 Tax=Plectus sambesii TaxID=2011161 RepID=A0A914V561_9BILA